MMTEDEEERGISYDEMSALLAYGVFEEAQHPDYGALVQLTARGWAHYVGFMTGPWMRWKQ